MKCESINQSIDRQDCSYNRSHNSIRLTLVRFDGDLHKVGLYQGEHYDNFKKIKLYYVIELTFHETIKIELDNRSWLDKFYSKIKI